MKKIFNYTILILFAFLTSCSSSDDGSAIDNGNGDGNENPNPNPTSQSYWPFALGNKWNLVNPDDSEDIFNYHIYKTINYDGKTYFQFEPIGSIPEVELTDGFREENGIFKALHGATSNMGVNTAAGIVTYINTKLNVGETWTDEVILEISGAASGHIKHTNQGKILDKVASVTINGKTYQDVIKTELRKTVFNSITGNSFEIIYENWLAKGVGIIYEKNTYDGNFTEQYELINHVLN